MLNLRNEINSFQNTDNFDDAQINVFAEKLLDLTGNLLRSGQKTIYDVAAVFDSLTYLLNAQVNN